MMGHLSINIFRLIGESMKFCERLSELRKERGFNQQYVAGYMGVTQVSISSWEVGFKEPNFQALIDLANLFDVTSDYLLGISDKRK